MLVQSELVSASVGTLTYSKEPRGYSGHECPSAEMMEMMEIGIEFW